MNTIFATACVMTHVETGEPILLAASSEEAMVQTAMDNFRAMFTQVAAQPGVEQDDYEKMMSGIRSLRLIPVRVTEVEAV